jgi:hypothetical protein
VPDVARRTVDEAARLAGMTKRSGTWYRQRGDVIAVLNLQRSQYSPLYYVNLAWWLCALGPDQFPSDHKCHVRMRADGDARESWARMAELLDLERDIPEEARASALGTLMRMEVLPFLIDNASVERLKTLATEGGFRHGLVMGSAFPFLGMIL